MSISIHKYLHFYVLRIKVKPKNDGEQRYFEIPLSFKSLFGIRHRKTGKPLKTVSFFMNTMRGEGTAMFCVNLFGHFVSLEVYYYDRFDILPVVEIRSSRFMERSKK